MAKLTDDMKEVAGKTKGFALATANKDGNPHVIPVGFGIVFSDDELLLVDVFMQETLENIKANPRAAVSVWDLGGFKGYEFKGNARVETSGRYFDECVKFVKDRTSQVNAKGAVIIKVDSITILSPGPDAGKKV